MTATANEVPLLKTSLLELAQKHKIWDFFDFGIQEDVLSSDDDILNQAFEEEKSEIKLQKSGSKQNI